MTTPDVTDKDGIELVCPAKAGETWHVRLPGASALATLLVSDMTAHTVEFTDPMYSFTKMRYKQAQVDFVEKAK